MQFVVSRRTLPAYFDFEDKALFENTVRAVNVVEKMIHATISVNFT